MTIPYIAFTWYVLIGAIATFAVGALASIMRPKRSTIAVIVFSLLALSSPKGICVLQAEAQTPANFAPVDKLINDSIAAHKLPGAVVVIGHNNSIAYKHTYGQRKLDGEPGLDGLPSAAEPMTEDTIFDMASLTKVMATTTSILHLVDEGKVNLDAPVEQYLPAFNAAHDATRAQVTVKMLLLHISGEQADVALKDPWGLAVADREEGMKRALTTPLQSKPNTVFRYSDINFILLGAIIEAVAKVPEDVYVQQNVFGPLGMRETRYLPAVKACAPRKTRGAAIAWAPEPAKAHLRMTCLTGTWSTSLIARIAPTAHDDEGNKDTNPDFDYLLRGVVHDPTTRRMGGVAGHAGLFSTAHDTAIFAQALLDKLLRNTGPFPVSQATLRLATTPQQPATLEPGTILTSNLAQPVPELQPVQGLSIHGLGWDINTAFSRNRGAVFATAAPSQPASPTPSFGHTGFTGTSLWIDPNTDSYVILLANGIHPRVTHPLSGLRGDVATAAAIALGLYPAKTAPTTKTQLGLDVLESTNFDALRSFTHIGVMTNQTGIDSAGKRTVDVLKSTGKLTKIFTPEHGLFGVQDTEHLKTEQDIVSGIPVISLYGAGAASRHPTHDHLKDLDAVVIDLQDAGVRYYTYEAVVGYFLEASADEQKNFNHKLTIVVLDRPNPVSGGLAKGPTSDPGKTSYVNYTQMPSQHGLTLGELAQFYNRDLHGTLTVVAMKNWTRWMFFDQTGLEWHNPSPNLRSLNEALFYTGLGLGEATNISVGRGTPTPFEQVGAPWIKAEELAAALNARKLPGVRFEATTVAIAEDANHYPFHGQTISAVRFVITDRTQLDGPRLGIEVMSALHRLYPNDYKLDKAATIIANAATLDALKRGDSPDAIVTLWKSSLDQFNTTREPFELY